MEDNIHITEMQPLFDDKVGFPSFEALTIGAVKILRNIWDNWELALASFSKLLGYKTLL